MGTTLKLHVPVVHVSFVLSAELRPCWFICLRKEELLRKRTFPCNLRQINVENHPEVADDSHINVSPQFILIQWEVPSTNVPPPHQLTGHPLCICIAKEKWRVHRSLRVGVEHKWFPHCELRYPSPEKTRGRIQNGSVMMFYVGGQPVWGG